MSFISPNTIVNDQFKIPNARVFYRDFANVPLLNPVGANEPQITFTRASTAMRTNSLGLLESVAIDTPRFDYDPVTRVCRGLLIEENRTNYLYRTTDPSLWTIHGGLIRDVNDAVSPDGTTNAVRIRNTPNVNSFTQFGGGPALPDGFYVRSIYVKPNGSIATIIFEGVGGTAGADDALFFDAVTKTFSGGSGMAAAVSYGFQEAGNGWLRVFVVVEKSATKIVGGNVYIGGYGNSPQQHDMWLYGPQIENGRFLTSYIPNSTTIALARAADHCIMTSAEFGKVYNYAEGTFLFDGMGGNETSQSFYSRFISYAGVATILSTDGSNTLGTWNGTTSLSRAMTVDPRNAFGKYMMGYTVNSRKITGQGLSVSSTGTGLANTSASFDIGFGGNTSNTNTNKLNGHIAQVAYYNRLLSDEMFREMTAP